MFRFTILLLCIAAPLTIARSIRPVTCGPVCAIFCKYGNVLDENDCPTCTCKKSPCKNEQDPLEGYNCSSGIKEQECPSSYKCIVGPFDAYAVCCPRGRQPVTKPPKPIEKPGSCPLPSTGINNCLAKCTTDDDCEGNLKCCGGNCPRECVIPSE